MHKQHYSYEDCKTVKLSSKVETERDFAKLQYVSFWKSMYQY